MHALSRNHLLIAGLGLVIITGALEVAAYLGDSPNECGTSWNVAYEATLGCWIGAGILLVAGRGGRLAYGVAILAGMVATAAAAPFVWVNAVGVCWN